MSEDLAMMTKFVDKWCCIILEESQNNFRMHKIYEQLIFISKNVEKFEWIRKKVGIDVEFSRYKVDKEMNKAIERKMRDRHMEKLTFYSQRSRKTELSEEMPHNQVIVKEKKPRFMEEDTTEA